MYLHRTFVAGSALDAQNSQPEAVEQGEVSSVPFLLIKSPKPKQRSISRSAVGTLNSRGRYHGVTVFILSHQQRVMCRSIQIDKPKLPVVHGKKAAVFCFKLKRVQQQPVYRLRVQSMTELFGCGKHTISQNSHIENKAPSERHIVFICKNAKTTMVNVFWLPFMQRCWTHAALPVHI